MAEPLLRVRDAYKRFDGREVLRGISFDLECGAVAALVGISGSGKSTVARCIAGFESLDSGEILLNGSSIAGRVAPAIQLILQQPAAALNRDSQRKKSWPNRWSFRIAERLAGGGSARTR
jgi:peptide/nickel transport system ATP-binding protein